MTDLTEKWKKGELPEGWYYVQYADEIEPDKYESWYNRNGVDKRKEFGFEADVQKVIAPVPTFDEWKASYNCMLENEVLRLKNAQLKELLKEVLRHELSLKEISELTKKISELLK